MSDERERSKIGEIRFVRRIANGRDRDDKVRREWYTMKKAETGKSDSKIFRVEA